MTEALGKLLRTIKSEIHLRRRQPENLGHKNFLMLTVEPDLGRAGAAPPLGGPIPRAGVGR